MVSTLMTLRCHDAKRQELNKSYISAWKNGCGGGRNGKKSKLNLVKLLSK